MMQMRNERAKRNLRMMRVSFDVIEYSVYVRTGRNLACLRYSSTIIKRIGSAQLIPP